MKQLVVFLFMFLLASCEKEELFVYNYSELDKLLVSVTRTDTDSEFRVEFKYDSINRLIEVRNIFPESPTSIESYVYDNKGKIVKKINGSYTTTYDYNPEGQLSEQNIHYASLQNDYDWNEKTVFIYKNGKINKGIHYSEDGEITQYINYKYDSRGNTLEKTIRPADFESDLNLEEIKFKYDSKKKKNDKKVLMKFALLLENNNIHDDFLNTNTIKSMFTN